MLQAVVIDDEVNSIENLIILLNRFCPEIKVAGTASDVQQGALRIMEVKPSIVFLDIQMPDGNGFDLLRKLTSYNFELIFVTAYDQYAIQAIKFSAIDYLLKPINTNELQSAVKRAITDVERKVNNGRLENLIMSITNKGHLRIAIPGNKETIFLSPDTILYCKSENNYTIFYLKNEVKHTSSKPIFEYEELLSSRGFIRCHQSFLVNILSVKSWIKTDGDRLLLEDGHEIPISRNSKEKVKQAMGLR